MNQTHIQIIKLTANDLEELLDISRETFYDSYASQNTEENMRTYIDQVFNYENLRKELNDPRSAFYFAKRALETTGYLKLNTGNVQTHFSDKNSLEVTRIYVKKQYQGQGIGKLFLDKAFTTAKEKAVDFIWLGVWENNPGAIRFYEKNGFIKDSTHSFMLGNDLQTDYIMKVDIRVEPDNHCKRTC